MDERKSTNRNRIWVIDALRGIAILMMAFFHLMFDLKIYYNYDINYSGGVIFYIGRISAILFMILSGVSTTFSRSSIRRGMKVLFCAMIVTLVSIPTMGNYYIRFGILHFFAVMMILKGFMKSKFINDWSRIVCAVALIPICFLLGWHFEKMTTTVPFLFPIGLKTNSFTSYDYYPIFPWGGYFSMGLVVGWVSTKWELWAKLERFKTLSSGGVAENLLIVKILKVLGRHSLVVYMLHQPILLAVLYIIHR